MPLAQSTPPSRRRRWQGTRGSFVDLVASLERCMETVGLSGTVLSAEIGDHEGTLASSEELRKELTEALWLSSRRISVSLRPSEGQYVMLHLVLGFQDAVLYVGYHGGTPQVLETLRVVVERALPPERPNPRRHWRWVGPAFGIAYSATWWLIASRLPGHWSIHTGWSQSVRDGVGAATLALNALVGGLFWPWLAFQFWFPPLERLPDTAKTHWDRRRGWVQLALPVWVAIVGILLALPETG